MIVYADSSFLASHYLQDIHSAEVDRRMALYPRVSFTSFHRAELTNAIFQQVFYGRLTRREAELADADCDKDCASGIWVIEEIPIRAFTVSAGLARRYSATLGVRTLDTLHVAVALELKADRFWTFDQRQAKLAKAEGLEAN